MTLAREFGELYLQRYREERDFLFIYQAVFSGHVTSEKLERMKSRDFQDENLVIVKGWYLSKTEARAMALAVLV